jgi:tetratricopeptide (TPR) repeat protein
VDAAQSLRVSDHGNLAYLGAGLQINHFSYGTPESIANLAPPTAPPEPSDPHLFPGRQEDVEAVLRILRDRNSLGVWLEGETGVGKSELARYVASALTKQGSRVWWIRATDGQALLASLVSIAYQAGAKEVDFRYMHPADVFWRALGGLEDNWVIILDDWVNAVNDRSGDSDGGIAWIRRPGLRGRFMVTSVFAPVAEFSWLHRKLLEPMSIDAASTLLVGLAPGAGTTDEAKTLAQTLHCNAVALVGAGRYLREIARSPSLDQGLPRTFSEYERAFRLTSEEDVANELFPYIKVLERSLDLLEGQGSTTAKPLASLISTLPGEPIPISLLSLSNGHAALSGVSGRQLSKGLTDLEGLKVLELRRSDDDLETMWMHGLVRDARRLMQRLKGEHMHNLDGVIAMLEQWADAHPSHAPLEWKAWQIVSPHFRGIGSGIDGAEADAERRRRILELHRRAAEFHYLAGQYEVAETVVHSLLERIAAQTVRDARLWVLANVLLARIRREQGYAPEARRLLDEIDGFARSHLKLAHTATREVGLSLARTVREEGDPEDALRRLAALIDFEVEFPKADVSVESNIVEWALLLNAGRCYRDLSRPDRAVAITQRLYENWDSWCTRDSLHFIDMQFEHAENLAAVGERDEAARMHSSNIEIARRLLGDDHLNVLILEATLLSSNYLALSTHGLKGEKSRLYSTIVDRFGDQHPLAVAVLDRAVD